MTPSSPTSCRPISISPPTTSSQAAWIATEARRRAVHAIGGLEPTRLGHRDARGLPWLEYAGVRRALCRQAPARRAGLHDRGHHHPGGRHRRQHGDLQCRQRHRVAAAAVCRGRSPGVDCARRPQRGPERPHVPGQDRRGDAARQQHPLRGDRLLRVLRLRELHAHGPRRRRADGRRAGGAALLRVARRATRAGTHLHRRGTGAQRSARDAADARGVAAHLCRRSRHRRADGHPQRRAGDGGRRAARGFRLRVDLPAGNASGHVRPGRSTP